MSRYETKVQHRLEKTKLYGQPPEKKCNTCGVPQTIQNSYVDITTIKTGKRCRFEALCDSCVSVREKKRKLDITNAIKEKPITSDIHSSTCNMCFVVCTPDNTSMHKTESDELHYHTRCNKCSSKTVPEHDDRQTESLEEHTKKKKQATGDRRSTKIETRQQMIDMFGAPPSKNCSSCDIPLTIQNAQVAKVQVTRNPDEHGVHKYKMYFNGRCDICRANKEQNRRTKFDSGAYAKIKKREAFCKKLGPPPPRQCEKCHQQATPTTTAIIHKHNKYQYSAICDACKPRTQSHLVATPTDGTVVREFFESTIKRAKQRLIVTCDCEEKQVETFVTVTIDDIMTLAQRQQFQCDYCHEKMHFFHTTKRDKVASLDRIDPNNRKYEINNVHWCCLGCNVRKGTKTHDQYMQYLQMEEETRQRVNKKQQNAQKMEQKANDIFEAMIQ